MGGTSKQEQQQQSSTRPLAEAMPAVNGLLGQITPQIGNTALTGAESGAISGLTANAAAGNPYAPAIGNLATDLLKGGTDRTGMVQDAFNTYKGSVTPYTTMDTNPYTNEAFTKATQYMTNDIQDRIKSGYAGAGYSPSSSGDYAKTLGEGISQGIAPTWLQAYSSLEGMKRGAQDSLYSAGNTTGGLLSGLDQTALGNRVQGVSTANDALSAQDLPYQKILAAEALRRGIPLENMAQLAGITVPLASLGTQTSGSSTGSYTMSPAQQAWGWLNALKAPSPIKVG